MTFGFLSPAAALLGLGILLSIGVLIVAERRSSRAARALDLQPARKRAAVPVAVALGLTGAIVALAAAQPVVSAVRMKEARTDAEALFVFDITRSMLASTNPGAASRLARGKAAAKQLRGSLLDVPVGVASLTDRLLPHLFPSPSLNAFSATVDRALAIERPPPDRARRGVATAFSALAVLGAQNFFGESTAKRVVVVVTDGESSPFDAPTIAAPLRRARITPVFVHFWAPDERVYERGGAIERYRPEPGTDTRLREIAAGLGGSAHGEEELGNALDAVRQALGEGPVGAYGAELQTRTLSVYILPFAFLPLAFVLWRRNF